MGIPEAQHETVVLLVLRVIDFHKAEVPLAFVTQAVGKSTYGKAVGFDGVLDLGDELDVWDMTGYEERRALLQTWITRITFTRTILGNPSNIGRWIEIYGCKSKQP